jgi:hypothetical protein
MLRSLMDGTGGSLVVQGWRPPAVFVLRFCNLQYDLPENRPLFDQFVTESSFGQG